MNIDYINFLSKKYNKLAIVGTTCIGKTTLVNQLTLTVDDMDNTIDRLFDICILKEEDFCSEWTEQIGLKMKEVVDKHVHIRSHVPFIGTVIPNEAEHVVLLLTSFNTLKQRCINRGVDVNNAVRMMIWQLKECIKRDVSFEVIHIK